MPKVIVTGFEPFADFSVNPAQQLAERLHGAAIGGAEVFGMSLPVVFGEDARLLAKAVEDLRPDVVLSLGLNDEATCLNVERVALNLRRQVDGEEAQLGGAGQQIRIVPDGPAAYFATIDVEEVVQGIIACGAPAQASSHAGNYLCNHIMYQALHLAASGGFPFAAGFVHVPQSQEQVVASGGANSPSLPFETMVAGVTAAVGASVRARVRGG